jgi:hypothetical protein
LILTETRTVIALTHTYKISLKKSCIMQSLWNALEVHESLGRDAARPKRWTRKLTVPTPKTRSRNRPGRRRREISEKLRAEIRRLAEPVKNRFAS